MTTRTTILVAALAALASLPAAAGGQAPAPDSARGPRHVLSLAVGMLPRMNVSAAGAESHGVLGGLSYQFWPAGDWNVEVSASTHSAAAHAWETHAVTSLLFGGNWYPRPLSGTGALRPYLGIAVGAYTASETRASEVRTQNVVGARLGGGVDTYPARWLRLGLRAAYHVAPDYDRPVDDVSSPSGPELSLQLGIAFGHR